VNRPLRAVLFASGLLTLLATPALAGNSTNPGAEIGCHYHVVCIINGQIVNGSAQEACNNGQVKVIKQCPRKH
jgi:hypothetical protein